MDVSKFSILQRGLAGIKAVTIKPLNPPTWRGRSISWIKDYGKYVVIFAIAALVIKKIISMSGASSDR